MVNVFVASHINVPMPRLDYCTPIQTGAVSKSPWPGFVTDDAGDNISAKNRYYGEMSGLYWMWKNASADKIGLCHYRRFFSPALFSERFKKGIEVDLSMAQTILDQDKTGALFDFELNFSQIIVPTLIPVSVSAADWYCASLDPAEWAAMVQGLYAVHPTEAKAAEAFLTSVQPLHFWCMFMARREVSDAYCQWLFPLLFHLETLITPSEDNFLCRVFGFLSEHLFNWWTRSRGLELVERPIIFLKDAKPKGIDERGTVGAA